RRQSRVQQTGPLPGRRCDGRNLSAGTPLGRYGRRIWRVWSLATGYFGLRRQILRRRRRICRYETIDTSIDHVFMSVVFNSVTTFAAMMPEADWNACAAARPAVRSGFCTIGADAPQQTKRYGRFAGRDLKGS